MGPIASPTEEKDAAISTHNVSQRLARLLIVNGPLMRPYMTQFVCLIGLSLCFAGGLSSPVWAADAPAQSMHDAARTGETANLPQIFHRSSPGGGSRMINIVLLGFVCSTLLWKALNATP